MKLVVTVDVEEDQWGVVPHCYATARNVYRLPTLQKLLNEFGIIPTYLLTYPVVQDPHAVGILREFFDDGKCEIGTHCHPWNTPPYEEPLNRWNSMLCNLPPTLQFEKVQRLHDAIQNKFETAPVAFRSGRWGFDAEVARNIVRLGYRIDTSMTPYTSWAQTSGPDFSSVSPRPYTFIAESPTDLNLRVAVAEVPASIGYLHGEFRACAKLAESLKSGPLRRLKLGGLLSRLQILRKVWLSPEMETPARMLQLVRQMRRQGYEVLNLVFHSSALMGGCGPFVRSEVDEYVFLRNLATFLWSANEEGVVFVTLSEAAGLSPAHQAKSAVLRHGRTGMHPCHAGSA